MRDFLNCYDNMTVLLQKIILIKESTIKELGGGHMYKKAISIISLSILSSTLSHTASALDLYVDNVTQQIYAAPGENRVKLGTFEKKED
jgi:hypothetical protein